MRIWRKPPSFWTNSHSILAKALRPFSYLVIMAARYRRNLATPYHAGVPVICVGNVSVGGTGKTPLVLALAHMLQQHGFTPHILSRGFGAKINAPRQVNVLDVAESVGDEPLLLAKVAPTWVHPDRVQTAKLACMAGADILLLDDGFQNPFLHQDIKLLVVDGTQGFGNGYVLPAGPLREPLSEAMARADATLMYGEMDDLAWAQTKPLFEVELVSNQLPTADLYLAFAAIGYPEKFFTSLRQKGFTLAKTVSFPDHHFYDAKTIQELMHLAKIHQAKLITTEKDAVKIPLLAGELIDIFTVKAQFKKNDYFNEWLFKKIKMV